MPIFFARPVTNVAGVTSASNATQVNTLQSVRGGRVSIEEHTHGSTAAQGSN